MKLFLPFGSVVFCASMYICKRIRTSCRWSQVVTVTKINIYEGYLVTTRRKLKAVLEVAFLGVFFFFFHFGIGPGIK